MQTLLSFASIELVKRCMRDVPRAEGDYQKIVVSHKLRLLCGFNEVLHKVSTVAYPSYFHSCWSLSFISYLGRICHNCYWLFQKCLLVFIPSSQIALSPRFAVERGLLLCTHYVWWIFKKSHRRAHVSKWKAYPSKPMRDYTLFIISLCSLGTFLRTVCSCLWPSQQKQKIKRFWLNRKKRFWW